MAIQFKGFRATKPVVRLIDADKSIYQAFFIGYDSAGNKRQFRYTSEISRATVSQRKRAAEVFCETMWEAMLKGWNPFLIDYPFFEKSIDDQMHLGFSMALDYALKIKIPYLSKYSVYDYNGCVRFMKKAAMQCGCENALVNSMERKDIRMIMATAKEKNGWSNKARNKYLTILKSLLTVLVDEDRIKFNPAHKIKNEPEEQGSGYKRLTDEEKEKIAGHLYQECPAFFEYLLFIYQLGIRRKENLLLKVRDINLQRSEILIRPEVAKTNKARIIPITHDINQILMGRSVWELPKEYYLFSNNKFAPGPNPYHPNIPTNWWAKYVQKDLGIDCKLYSLKHKGADDKIYAGIPLDALKNMYGHKSRQMTEIYAAAVKDKYNQQIIDNAPAFTAKVVKMKKEA